jgi:ribose-phosphate pyrophosphokinase
MIIVGGPASASLAKKVSEILKFRFLEVENKVFPDGESYVRLKGEVKGEDVAIIQSTGPPQNKNLVELLLMIDASSRCEASNIIAVVPYLAYARQDKVFLTGEPVSVEVLLEIFRNLGVRRLITVNVHSPEVLVKAKLESINLSASKILAQYFLGKGLKGAMVFAPDVKASSMAEEASKILGGGYGFFEKQRDRITGEITMRLARGEVKGKKALIIDDIISSGGTTARAARLLKKEGAVQVFSACVHALLAGDAYNKIIEAGAEEVVSTDTIQSPVSKVSVAPLIAEELGKYSKE